MPDRHGHGDQAHLGGLTDVEEALATAYRREWAQVLATVVRLTRDVDAAQDAVQEAFASALDAWRAAGVPANPGAWLTATARRKAVDARRREETRRAPAAAADRARADDRVRLPRRPAAADLHLLPPRAGRRLPGGVDAQRGLRPADGRHRPAVPVPEPTMAARVTRAKRKLRAAGIPYRVPARRARRTAAGRARRGLPAVLPGAHARTRHGADRRRGGRPGDRPGPVAGTGCCPTSPRRPVCSRCCCSPTRVGRRGDAAGAPVLLADQDRTLWDRMLIAEGTALVEELPPGPYAYRPRSPPSTQPRPRRRHRLAHDPSAVRRPPAVHPSPVAALARSMAYAEVAGPAAGLDGARGRGGGLSAWPATTCSRPPAPTCCAARAGSTRRRGRTRRRPGWPGTRWSGSTCFPDPLAWRLRSGEVWRHD